MDGVSISNADDESIEEKSTIKDTMTGRDQTVSENQKPTESRFILWRILEVLEKIFCIVPVVIMTVIVFAAVVCRYILIIAIGWSEDITLMCRSW